MELSDKLELIKDILVDALQQVINKHGGLEAYVDHYECNDVIEVPDKYSIEFINFIRKYAMIEVEIDFNAGYLIYITINYSDTGFGITRIDDISIDGIDCNSYLPLNILYGILSDDWES